MFRTVLIYNRKYLIVFDNTHSPLSIKKYFHKLGFKSCRDNINHYISKVNHKKRLKLTIKILIAHKYLSTMINFIYSVTMTEIQFR